MVPKRKGDNNKILAGGGGYLLSSFYSADVNCKFQSRVGRLSESRETGDDNTLLLLLAPSLHGRMRWGDFERQITAAATTSRNITCHQHAKREKKLSGSVWWNETRAARWLTHSSLLDAAAAASCCLLAPFNPISKEHCTALHGQSIKMSLDESIKVKSVYYSYSWRLELYKMKNLLQTRPSL